jgi:NADPH-dependent ferric siderophore reductase
MMTPEQVATFNSLERVAGEPPGHGDALERAVRSVAPVPGERVFAWMAAEAGVLRPLRRWVRHELGLGAGDTGLTGYWKRGVADFDDD